MSIRAYDLSRWKIPTGRSPQETVHLCSPLSHIWEVMPIHAQWLKECSVRYGFENIDETLRHLIFYSNAESNKTKRLIFRIKRCLHCHVGARAGQHKKLSLKLTIHQFQWQWLSAVTRNCSIPSVEKSVRIICDFYQSRVKEVEIKEGLKAAERRELEIFGTNRSCDYRLTVALSQWRRRVNSDDDESLGDGDTVKENEQVYVNNVNDMKNPQEKLLAGGNIQDAAACSDQDIRAAIARCQVGRNSAYYAAAKGETAEETARRRAKERAVENSEEFKQARALIRKTLGSVMG